MSEINSEQIARAFTEGAFVNPGGPSLRTLHLVILLMAESNDMKYTVYGSFSDEPSVSDIDVYTSDPDRFIKLAINAICREYPKTPVDLTVVRAIHPLTTRLQVNGTAVLDVTYIPVKEHSIMLADYTKYRKAPVLSKLGAAVDFAKHFIHPAARVPGTNNCQAHTGKYARAKGKLRNALPLPPAWSGPKKYKVTVPKMEQGAILCGIAAACVYFQCWSETGKNISAPLSGNGLPPTSIDTTHLFPISYCTNKESGPLYYYGGLLPCPIYKDGIIQYAAQWPATCAYNEIVIDGAHLRLATPAFIAAELFTLQLCEETACDKDFIKTLILLLLNAAQADFEIRGIVQVVGSLDDTQTVPAIRFPRRCDMTFTGRPLTVNYTFPIAEVGAAYWNLAR